MDKYNYAFLSYIYLLRGLRSNDRLVAMSIPSIKILGFKCNSPLKGQEILWEMADSRVGAKKMQDDTGTYLYDIKKCIKNHSSMSKRQVSHIKGVLYWPSLGQLSHQNT